MQRLFDIVFAVIATITLLPVLLPIAIVLRLTGEGEIFYKQVRIGKKGKEIKIIKFATMLKDSPKIGNGTVTLKDDPRVLPVGKFLRKTKLNELPQLLNILQGDMSLIGPRPQTRRCFEAFPEIYQKEIQGVRPGLSGVGSIYFRNEEEMMDNAQDADVFYDSVIMPYKGKLEKWYVQKQSISLYFILIFSTLVVVLTGRVPLQKTVFASIPKPPNQLRKYL